MKWNALKDFINSKIAELNQTSDNTNSITDLAKESELVSILQEMRRLDVEFNQDRKFEEQVKSENDSLSESADVEWERTDRGFYFSDVPIFDRAAWKNILKQSKSNKSSNGV